MALYVEGSDRSQVTLLPECLDDYIAEDNLVRMVEAFVEELDLDAVPGAEAVYPRGPSATSLKTSESNDRGLPAARWSRRTRT